MAGGPAVRIVGARPPAAFTLALLFLRERPADVGLALAFGDTEAEAAAAAARQPDRRRASRRSARAAQFRRLLAARRRASSSAAPAPTASSARI